MLHTNTEKFVEHYLQKKGFLPTKMFIYQGVIVLLMPNRIYHENEIQVKKDLKQYFNLIAYIRVTEENFKFTKRILIADDVRAGKLTQQEFQTLVK